MRLTCGSMNRCPRFSDTKSCKQGKNQLVLHEDTNHILQIPLRPPVYSRTCIALVTLSARKHFSTRSFWKASRSVFHGSGNGSLRKTKKIRLEMFALWTVKCFCDICYRYTEALNFLDKNEVWLKYSKNYWSLAGKILTRQHGLIAEEFDTIQG